MNGRNSDFYKIVRCSTEQANISSCSEGQIRRGGGQTVAVFPPLGAPSNLNVIVCRTPVPRTPRPLAFFSCVHSETAEKEASTRRKQADAACHHVPFRPSRDGSPRFRLRAFGLRASGLRASGETHLHLHVLRRAFKSRRVPRPGEPCLIVPDEPCLSELRDLVSGRKHCRIPRDERLRCSKHPRQRLPVRKQGPRRWRHLLRHE